MNIILKQSVPFSRICFVVPHDESEIKLSQGDELTVIQDLGPDATKILVQTSDDPRDNAWIPIEEYVLFPEL